jgi:ubiquitin carboxyl-terminal hydrolase 5/13
MAAQPTPEAVAAAVAVVRRHMPSFKAPTSSSARVSKSECSYAFDTPQTVPGGLFLNVATHTSTSEAFLALDRRRTGGAVYVQQRHRRVAKSAAASSSSSSEASSASAPTKLAIGLPGGFDTDTPAFDVVKEHAIVVFLDADPNNVESRVTFPWTPPAPPASSSSAASAASAASSGPAHPAPPVPEFLLTVAAALLAHEDVSVAQAASAWQDARPVSAHSLDLSQLPNGKAVSRNPKDWACEAPGGCDKTENLWLNLSTGFIGCGRRQYDGSGGNEHAVAHYRATGSAFPLAVKLGTITAAGADVYSYAPEEDDMVEDPHLGACRTKQGGMGVKFSCPLSPLSPYSPHSPHSPLDSEPQPPTSRTGASTSCRWRRRRRA